MAQPNTDHNHKQRKTDNSEREMESRSSYEPEKIAKDVSLQELRDRLAEFARVRGWEQYHSPRNLLLALVINQTNNTLKLTSRSQIST